MTSAFRQERRRALARERVDIDYGELKSIVAQTGHGPLSDEQRTILDDAIDSFAHVQQKVASGAGIRDIRRFLGWPSEKTKIVLGGSDGEDSDDGDQDDDNGGQDDDGGQVDDGRADAGPTTKRKKKRKKRESGRRPASDYTGATVVDVDHETLSPKDDCPDPECKGKVYPLPEPAKVIRITGMSPLAATLYNLARLRCNLCGTVYTADLPEGAGDAKYDETVPAMIGILRYAYGLPHNRLSKLCDNLGVPTPSSTQWDIVNDAADALMPVFDELVVQAAQGDVITIDDTHMKVIELGASLAKAYADVAAKVEAGELPKSALAKQRTGIHTTGMVSTGTGGGDIVLFLTGANHAGENFQDVLARRAAELELPIRMADALSWNFMGELEAIDANCLVHGRRQFVAVVGSFPDEVEFVLEQLRLVYKHDHEAKEAKMTAAKRLAHHQEHSKPVIDDLEEWMRRQIDDKLVEPNSSLGAALAYLEDHWDQLTLFLHIAGAPLDGNIVERALKIAIRHRRNSLFYRSERGAKVGDCFMSLIHTAERCGVNSFEYLVAVLRHHERAGASPADWMPWSYAATMARFGLS